MKNIIGLFILALVSGVAIAQDTKYDTIQYEKAYYEKRVAMFKNDPVVKSKIIFLGNSITQFGDWKKLLGDSTVINRGIAGDNTHGVSARLQDIIIRQPSRLFIEIGINDIAQGIPAHYITKNIRSIIERVHLGSPATKIYIFSILPTNNNVKEEYPAVFNTNNIVSSVNRLFKKEAIRDRCIYIDINSKLKDSNGNLDQRFAKSDGLHLNQSGYDVLIKLMKSRKYF